MTKAELNRQNEIALESFLLHGGVITVLKTYKPRKSERVLSGTTKGSIQNMGSKAANLRNIGIYSNSGAK